MVNETQNVAVIPVDKTGEYSIKEEQSQDASEKRGRNREKHWMKRQIQRKKLPMILMRQLKSQEKMWKLPRKQPGTAVRMI